MDFNNYLFRASQVGKIFSSKGDWTDTNKKALTEIYVQETTGFRMDITNKYWEKGTFCEPEARDLVQILHPNVFFPKNSIRKENDYISGEWDIVAGDIVYDTKVAWDYLSFSNAKLSIEYEWQLRCYMWILGLPKARLAYCLVNTPEHILYSEYNRIKWKNGFIDEDNPTYVAMCEEFKKLHTFDHIPATQRIRIWEIEHDQEKIDKILIPRIDKGREMLNKMHVDKLEHAKYVESLIQK